MPTPDEVWSARVKTEVLGEENASDADVDKFHGSDKSQILNNASRGRSLVAAQRDLEVVVEDAHVHAVEDHEDRVAFAVSGCGRLNPFRYEFDDLPPEPEAAT